ncbi:MAG: hypothetical protein ACI9EF_000207 [Pseudohongiellaceae bacterium]|jgi:hypothetical protein
MKKAKLMIIALSLLGLCYLGMQLAGDGDSPEAFVADRSGGRASKKESSEPPSITIAMVDEDGNATTSLTDDRGQLNGLDSEFGGDGQAPDALADKGQTSPEETGSDGQGESQQQLSVLAQPARAGMVGILMRIEQHGRATGVECQHIEAPSKAGETYQLRGRGAPQSLAIFLASLEQDSSLGGASSLRVWAEDERVLGFRAQLIVAEEARD